ncbi:MAG: inseCt neurotoxin 1c [Ruminococcus sp.]|nr:inseCt neurotoxin 1c [Ruminococcus sp.]
MNGFIIFMLGCMAGGFVGVTVMSLLQINRINCYETKESKEDDTDEKRV